MKYREIVTAKVAPLMSARNHPQISWHLMRVRWSLFKSKRSEEALLEPATERCSSRGAIKALSAVCHFLTACCGEWDSRRKETGQRGFAIIIMPDPGVYLNPHPSSKSPALSDRLVPTPLFSLRAPIFLSALSSLRRFSSCPHFCTFAPLRIA